METVLLNIYQFATENNLTEQTNCVFFKSNKSEKEN
jgi:hypothetical protein